MMRTPTFCLVLLLNLCLGSPVAAQIELLSFRFRSDDEAPLNADWGWAATENASAEILYDVPFRLRVQVRAARTPAQGHTLRLQYRQAEGPWLMAAVAEFPYPPFANPLLSIVTTDAYSDGDETVRLLGESTLDWDDGAGLSGRALTPVWRGGNDAIEWEWPLVVRRFSDGPTFAEDGSEFALRVVDGFGNPLSSPAAIAFTARAAPGHLGGTFIETPGRIGPYQSANGDLYFLMEPSETDNRFMVVRSEDYGTSWREVDGVNRPRADDLEGVASVRVGNTLHIIHQVTREVFHHAFELAGPDSGPGGWRIDSQSIAAPGVPATQFADVVARSDGSLVAAYSGARRLFLQVRSSTGVWGEPEEIDTELEPELSGPVMVTGAEDVITLAYTGRDGRGFVRHLHPDGSLTPRASLSANLGSDDSENGAILPLVSLPERDLTVIVYRETDGLLYQRNLQGDGRLSAAVLVTNLAVTTDAVDSEQAGADLVSHGEDLHLLFIEQQSRSIYHTHAAQGGAWSAPVPVIEGIDGAWVRGSVHRDANGNPVYGFVYDGGSDGGSGMNRYFALPL